MVQKKITYTDYDGNERTETFYFNLTKAEVTRMNFAREGGLLDYLQTIIDGKDVPAIMKAYETIITSSYGVKSPDGKKFIKSKELLDEFMATEAYSDLYMELLEDGVKAAEFVKGIMPKNMIKQDLGIVK